MGHGVLPFTIRFVCGGLVVAAVPLVGRRFNPFVAGLTVLIPVVTLLGFYFLGREEGIDAVQRASTASLLGLPALICFIGTVCLLSWLRQDLLLTMLAALGVWVVLTVPLVLLARSGR